MVGDDYRRHLAAAGAGPAAPGIVVAFVEDHDERVVAPAPERRIGDLAHQLAEIRVACTNKTLVLGVVRRAGRRVAGVHAVRRVAVHVAALVGDDPAESRHLVGGKVVGQLVTGHLARPVGSVQRCREVGDAYMLGDVKRIDVGHTVALRRVADPLVAGMWQTLKVSLPADAGDIHLAHQALGVDLVDVVRIVVVDAKRAAAEHGDVVGFTGVGDTEVVGGEAELLGEVVGRTTGK
jgi:hypothetical protein